jgi:hypothetical protein
MRVRIVHSCLIMMLLSGLMHPAARAGVSYFAEQVHLHTCRDIYVAGETLSFRASLITQPGSNSRKSRFMYLVLRNKSGHVHTATHLFEQDRANGFIYLHDTLSTGYYELIAYTNWMRNMGEDSFFCKTVFVANRFDRGLEAINDAAVSHPSAANGVADGLADPDMPAPAHALAGPHAGRIAMNHPTHAGRREKVEVALLAEDMEAAWTHFSVSVSEVETLAADPSAKTKSDPATVSQSFSVPQQPAYFMESNGWILSGHITEAETGKAIEGARVILNTPGNTTSLMVAGSGQHGAFHFSMPEAFNNRELYLSVDPSSTAQETAISVWDKYALTRPFDPDLFVSLTGKKSSVNRSQDIVRARIAYETAEDSRRSSQGAASVPVHPLYSHAVQVVYPNEYTPFDDLQEIAREIIPFWRIRRSGNTYSSTLICAETRMALPESPVYFIDGIIVHDINRLIYLDSELIEKIEVQNLQWVFGDMLFNGIVSIFTATGEFRRIVPDLPLVRVSHVFDGQQLPDAAFPSYEKQETTPDQPDLRQLLYWNPDVPVNADGRAGFSFYTGDLPGRYLIRVEGVTRQGQLVGATGVINVQ